MKIDKIKKLCAKEGIAIPALEKAVGLGESVIYKWEKNDPGIGRVKKVADYFGVTVNDLLDYPPESTLSEEEKQLLRSFQKLNEDGQDKVMEYIQDIAPRYIKNQSSERLEEEA
ncbi:MAG: helix-turn-helix transcriptional regulator [Firmicutes bacterium]|nr:helix-turn-helix transcriptional regulator [Bacillota bacterium]